MWRYDGLFGILGDWLHPLAWLPRRVGCVLFGHDGRLLCVLDDTNKYSCGIWNCTHEKLEHCIRCGAERTVEVINIGRGR